LDGSINPSKSRRDDNHQTQEQIGKLTKKIPYFRVMGILVGKLYYQAQEQQVPQVKTELQQEEKPELPLGSKLPPQLQDRYVTLSVLCSKEGTKGVGKFPCGLFNSV
jgi:hypothetical protein